MSEPTKAVFLSYARDDAAAARRIAEALRSAGLEVWFDESELRGGDQWDAKIRKQIDACTLFVPVISQHTQERSKGYFRLEWKLAVDQTHLLAAGVPFIAPVVIDDTTESAAVVPPEFMRVQWTHLPGALPTPQFVGQVKRLLEDKVAPVSDRRSAETKTPDAGHRPALQKKPAIPGWTWGALTAVVVGLAVYLALRPAPVGPVSDRPHSESPSPASVLPARPEPAERTPASPPKADAKSIAVLPFANLSADADNAFFADGMHDDLITALAKIRDLKVISRTSVMPYKTGERNLRKIAAELGVATVLEGSVQRAGNRVRLNVQLIDARTDGHLWAETYNKELTDVFTIQAALAEEITTALKATLTPGERTLIARRPTENQEAYDLYLRARLLDQSLSLTATKEAYETVFALYEQAAAADPKFALPHVQASILHGTMYWLGQLDATPERRARVEAELEAAQRLAPDAPETHLARGSYEYTCRNDWARSLVEYRKAEAGLPNDAQLISRIAFALRRLGQLAEAQRRFETAVGLNPSDLNPVQSHFDTLLEMRRYRRIVDEIGRFVAMFPTDRRLLTVRHRARYGLDGDRPAFLRDMAALPPTANDPHGLAADFATAMRVGDLAAAERILEDPRMPPSVGEGNSLSYPVSLTRARLAWLRGRPEDARRFADEAIAHLRSMKWMPRQEPDALMGVALAEAFAGRQAEALRDGRAALADQTARDVYAGAGMQNEFGQLLLVCGQRDEALAVLRTRIAGLRGAIIPDEIRFDPIWSRLKTDPRFEEILKSAKPL